MENPPLPQPPTPQPTTVSAKFFGIGNAGASVLQQLKSGGLEPSMFVAVNTESLDSCCAAEKLRLETIPLRGLGSGGDPERGRTMAEEHGEKLKELCQGANVVFIVAGLGGGAGTGISPVIARVAREAGALVLAFVTLPFECEGSRRQRLAQQGLQELRENADGVICLPNQKVSSVLEQDVSVLEAFRAAGGLLAEGILGIWRLLTHKGLIEIHPAELCNLLRDGHTESVFATAEATGPTRSREVLDKLLAHPLLDRGEILSESSAVLVSILGGPDLTMTEVNRIMEDINAKCAQAQVLMGAALDADYSERLAVTLVAGRPTEPEHPAARGEAEDLPAQLLPRISPTRPHSRFVPPAPSLGPDKVQQMLDRQGSPGSRPRRSRPKLRQSQLPLEIVSKGRFDKSEPTIHKGEDLDVPTYIRRGVALN